MNESLRILALLIYKNWLTRKKWLWKLLIFGIIIPFLVIFFGFYVSQAIFSRPSQVVKSDSNYEKISLKKMLLYGGRGKYQPYVIFAPHNSFTWQIMGNTFMCSDYNIYIWGHATERELIEDYYSYDDGNKKLVVVGVIFDQTINESTKHFNYKFRYKGLGLLASPLYNYQNYQPWLLDYYVRQNWLAQVQICLERSFVKLTSKRSLMPVSVQEIPDPKRVEKLAFDETCLHIIYVITFIALTIPFTIEALIPWHETFTGGTMLLSLSGISYNMIALGWMASGFLFLIVFLHLPMFMLMTIPSTDLAPFFCYGNFCLLYLILMFYIAHQLAFGIHASVYFKGKLFFLLIILNNLLSFILPFDHTETAHYLTPYAGLIFPNILFLQSLREIRFYESIGEGIQWSNIFVSANPYQPVGECVGMALLFFVIGTFCHFILGIYVYTVLPGKFKPGRHPLFFLKSVRMRSSASDLEESVESGERNSEYFEPVPEGVYVSGIQIRNLKKTYESGILHKQKVEALRGVTIDFYKGQITALLGPNGAGKTTMMSILAGITHPTSGMVLIDSKDLNENHSEIMEDIGVCAQENYHFELLTVKQQLEFYAKLKRKNESFSAIEVDVRDLLQRFKLNNVQNLLPRKLSGGQQRLLSLCRVLVGMSNTLILDEPTTGLDPANRRIVWNILLKMRGEKTILISTHDMEEADILGDKIAIMQTGQMKSYGTPSFLKKLIGQNNIEVVCSIDSRSDPERIRKELHANGAIKSRETKRIIVSIPNSPQLPDSLDNLERKKKELGISGFSVTLIGLEQVFTKITQKSDESPESSQTIGSKETQTEGHSNLHLQTVRALFLKKKLYALKDFSRFRKIYTVITLLLLHTVILITLEDALNVEEDLIRIRPEMYLRSQAFYTSYDKDLGDQYKSVVQNLRSNPVEVTNTNLDSALMRRAKENFVAYDRCVIAGVEFNHSFINAFYSETAVYSLPISINLIHNAMIKHLAGSDYSINLSYHIWPSQLHSILDKIISIVSKVAFSLTFYMSTLAALFLVQPAREFSSNFKHIQRMTGVSGLTYWGTMFLFDLMEFGYLILFMMISLICMDVILGLGIIGFTEFLIETLLLLSFGINTLPIIYSLSFLRQNLLYVMAAAILTPVIIVIFDGIISFKDGMDRNSIEEFHLDQGGLLPLLPYVSFFHTQISFFLTAYINEKCRRLPNHFYESHCGQRVKKQDFCCGFDCYNGKCENPKTFFSDNDDEISLGPSVKFLCLTPILYFIILALLESKYVEKKFSDHEQYRETVNVIDPDAQVELERAKVNQQIQTLNADNPNMNDARAELPEDSSNIYYFLAHELRKRYDQVKAVKDVSFGVDRQECFGLLGVNGAGKTTTFRVITGGERPDNGIMYMGVKNSEADRKSFLAEIGYCPQNDALLKCLNSYDHLRLFASLRGIPEDKVESEVQAWIDRLNLNACAERSSGTYSGGNKRRLSVANALIGNPSLIILDEPTTGIDPEMKRSLWNFVKARQAAGQTFILSSHSTEECEVLCNRLAIMVDGRLVCIGVSEELKQRYGVGYDIKIRMNLAKSETQLDDIKKDMSRMLSCTLSDEYLANLVYHVVPDVNTTWRKMYDVMNGLKMKFDCIEEFSILSSSLEQVFMVFAKTVDRPIISGRR